MNRHNLAIMLDTMPVIEPPGEGLMSESFSMAAAEPELSAVPTVLGIPISSRWTWEHVIEPVLQAFTS